MKPPIVLIVAAVAAGLVAIIVRSSISTPDKEPVAALQVLVASDPIPAGSFIRAETHLRWAEWPESNLQPTFYTAANTKPEQFNGAVARRSIAAGEPITQALMVKPSEGGFLPAVLDPGMRAVSIAVNAISGNAGFVFPGDKVDLILTHQISVSSNSPSGENNLLASETFLEDIRVVAVDQMLDNPENKAVLAKTITLEVSPKQAEVINVATDLGKISLSLRSLAAGSDPEHSKKVEETSEMLLKGMYPSQHTDSITRDSDVSKLLSRGGGMNAKVQVIRGKEVEQLEFNQGN